MVRSKNRLHFCVSDAEGACVLCARLQRVARSMPKTGTVSRPGALVSAQRTTGHRIMRAEGKRLKALARAEAVKVAEAREEAARQEIARQAAIKVARAEAEAERAREGAERRAARAAKVAERAQQRESAQRRAEGQRWSDPSPVYAVAICFAGGAHGVEVAIRTPEGGLLRLTGQPFGKGWRESRSSANARNRDSAEGLRYGEAASIATGIDRSLGRNAPGRVARRPKRRKRRRG
jgi:hypothetical protein